MVKDTVPNGDTVITLLALFSLLNVVGLAANAWIMQLHTRTMRDILNFGRRNRRD